MLDCTKFSKTALKAMLDDQAFAVHHAAIKEFLTPKPKDMAPVEGKIHHRLSKSSMSTTVYPKGYVRLEINNGNGCLYKEAAEEMIAHLQAVLPSLKTR